MANPGHGFVQAIEKSYGGPAPISAYGLSSSWLGLNYIVDKVLGSLHAWMPIAAFGTVVMVSASLIHPKH
jgi:hypothetical protein